MFVIKEGCPGCGNCQAVCPVGAIEHAGMAVKINDKCVDCGICTKACPVKLIEPGPKQSPVPPAVPVKKSSKEPERSDE